jgi:hypothetical protein
MGHNQASLVTLGVHPIVLGEERCCSRTKERRALNLLGTIDLVDDTERPLPG